MDSSQAKESPIFRIRYLHVGPSAQQYATDVSVFTFCEDFSPGRLTQGCLLLHRGEDFFALKNHSRTTGSCTLTFQSGEDARGFFDSVMLDQPTRRFWEEWKSDEDHDKENALKRDRPPPCKRRWLCLATSKTHECAEGVAKSNESALYDQQSLKELTSPSAIKKGKTDTYAPVVALEALSLPNRNIHSIDAIANARDNTGDNQLHTTN